MDTPFTDLPDPDLAHQAVFALGANIPRYAVGTSTNPEDLYGPRYRNAQLIRIDGDPEYDDNGYYTPSRRVLVATDTVDQLEAAFTAATLTFLATDDGMAFYANLGTTCLSDLLHYLPDDLLWAHGIVIAADEHAVTADLSLDTNLVHPDQIAPELVSAWQEARHTRTANWVDAIDKLHHTQIAPLEPNEEPF